MMSKATVSRFLAAGAALAAVSALAVVTSACGGVGGSSEGAQEGAAEGASDLDAARDRMNRIVSAAQAGDLTAAQEALESTDADLAAPVEGDKGRI